MDKVTEAASISVPMDSVLAVKGTEYQVLYKFINLYVGC